MLYIADWRKYNNIIIIWTYILFDIVFIYLNETIITKPIVIFGSLI